VLLDVRRKEYLRLGVICDYPKGSSGQSKATLCAAFRQTFLVIGRGATAGFFPEGVTLSCSGFTLDADIGKAPSKKSGCDIAPVCQSCAYTNPAPPVDRLCYGSPSSNLLGAP
jgi:hypothetical protein